MYLNLPGKLFYFALLYFKIMIWIQKLEEEWNILLYLLTGGYRAVSHTGALWGHYSTLEIFPDIGLGVFSATNGPGGRPRIRQLVELYVGK